MTLNFLLLKYLWSHPMNAAVSRHELRSRAARVCHAGALVGALLPALVGCQREDPSPTTVVEAPLPGPAADAAAAAAAVLDTNSLLAKVTDKSKDKDGYRQTTKKTELDGTETD